MARRPGMGGKHNIHYALQDALEQEGCPVCRLAAAAVARYLDDLIYENVNEIELRETLRAAGGFCNEHSWQLERMHAAFGVSIVYRDVLNNMARRLRARPAGARLALFGGRDGRLRDRLAALASGAGTVGEWIADPHAACPACRVRLDREDVLLRALLEGLSDAELAARYARADGLCMVHLEQASALTTSALDASLGIIIEQALARIQTTLAELDEFVRKHDYRFRGEEIGAEGAAWLRAIAMVAGREGLR